MISNCLPKRIQHKICIGLCGFQVDVSDLCIPEPPPQHRAGRSRDYISQFANKDTKKNYSDFYRVL